VRLRSGDRAGEVFEVFFPEAAARDHAREFLDIVFPEPIDHAPAFVPHGVAGVGIVPRRRVREFVIEQRVATNLRGLFGLPVLAIQQDHEIPHVQFAIEGGGAAEPAEGDFSVEVEAPRGTPRQGDRRVAEVLVTLGHDRVEAFVRGEMIGAGE
jgi:hypothetical protein